MARRPVIIGIGEVLWDMLPAGKQLGGAPANFAYHARALGADAYVVSRVGDDEPGHEILRRLDGLGLNRQFVSVDPTHPTGTVDVRLDDKGVPSYVIHEDVAWDFIPQTPQLAHLVHRADAVCYGTLAQRNSVSRRTITGVVAAAQPRCLRVFDVNFRQHYYQRDAFKLLLHGGTNVLKLNEDEVPVLAKLTNDGESVGNYPVWARMPGDPMYLASFGQQYELPVIALTRGGRGSVLFIGGKAYEHPGFPAEVVDTVGAGDAFTAALVMGLLDGHEPDRINAFANRLAAYVCSQPGATPPIPAELLSSR